MPLALHATPLLWWAGVGSCASAHRWAHAVNPAKTVGDSEEEEEVCSSWPAQRWCSHVCVCMCVCVCVCVCVCATPTDPKVRETPPWKAHIVVLVFPVLIIIISLHPVSGQ